MADPLVSVDPMFRRPATPKNDNNKMVLFICLFIFFTRQQKLFQKFRHPELGSGSFYQWSAISRELSVFCHPKPNTPIRILKDAGSSPA